MPIVAPSSITDEGVSYWLPSSDGKSRHSELLKWTDIVSVDAFKRDLFSYDLICVQLRRKDQEEPVEFDEEGSDWEELMTALPKYLPGCRSWSECFAEVAHPAFRTNTCRLFERAPIQPPQTTRASGPRV